MKVKELIEKLKNMPQDVDVVFTYIKNQRIEEDECGDMIISSDVSECEQISVSSVEECEDIDRDAYVEISNNNDKLFDMLETYEADKED